MKSYDTKKRINWCLKMSFLLRLSRQKKYNKISPEINDNDDDTIDKVRLTRASCSVYRLTSRVISSSRANSKLHITGNLGCKGP